MPTHRHTHRLARIGHNLTTRLTRLGWRPFSRAPRLALAGFVLVTASVLLGAVQAPPAAHATVQMDLALPANQGLNTPRTLLTEQKPEWRAVTVKSGDTLESIFHQQGLSSRLLHQVVYLNDDTRTLTRIMPGQEIYFLQDDEQGFLGLKVEREDDAWLFVEPAREGLASRMEQRSLQREMRLASGVIQQSFYLAGQEADLSDNLILKMANIFGWDIDFILDIRQGDQFYVLYEEIRRDGEFLRDGEVLAATFINQGEMFEAVAFDQGNGIDYYTPEGRPMRKAFLRAPLNFLSINSNFNPRRMHPVLKKRRPHNGIDYGAHHGAPVFATGDGTVIASTHNKLNGNYVFIKHPNNIITKYLHFSKRAVKKGQRVRQGQTIGYVGATGRVTGTHLHYEFIVNGVHRNPRTIKLPEAKPIPTELMQEFQVAATPLQKHLTRLYDPETRLLAQAD